MAAWSRNKIDSQQLNNGNQYDKNSQFTLDEMNAIVNGGLYSQDFVEHLADIPDNTQANQVGTASVSIIDNNVNGKTYKKFKFSNIKGQKGDTGNGIYSIIKTSSSGLSDTYTITFTNGTTRTFVVKNGDSVDIRVYGKYLQWKYSQSTTWNNLINLEELFEVDQTLSLTSTKAIANKTVTAELDEKLTIGTNQDVIGLKTFIPGVRLKSNIQYQGTTAISDMIKFIDNAKSSYGNGISIGGGGITIIGGGASSDEANKNSGYSPENKQMLICNDKNVQIHTNLQSGWIARKSFIFDIDGSFTMNGGKISYDTSTDTFTI